MIAGAGTGGTISGVGRYLKEKNPSIKVIAVDQVGSIYYYIDDIVQVDDKESFNMTRLLLKEEGIFAGGSSGSAVAGLLKCSSILQEKDTAVVILPDSGSRYLSKIYNDKWMKEKGYIS